MSLNSLWGRFYLCILQRRSPLFPFLKNYFSLFGDRVQLCIPQTSPKFTIPPTLAFPCARITDLSHHTPLLLKYAVLRASPCSTHLLWSVSIIPPNNPVRSLPGINPVLHIGKPTLTAHYPSLGSQSLCRRPHTVLISFEVVTKHWTGGSSGEEGFIVADKAGATSIVVRKAKTSAPGGDC